MQNSECGMQNEGCEKRRKAKPNYGGVAQLGEHLPCKQGVMGSNPIISTKRTKCAMQNSECGMQNEGSEKKKFLLWSFFGYFLYTESNTQMFIENRIKKRNETDSCILRKTCYWDIFSKRFFRTKEVGKKQFRQLWQLCILHYAFCIDYQGGQISEL